MLFSRLKAILTGDPAPAGRSRLDLSEWPAALYVVGDVHGCLSLLEEMERMILDDQLDPPGEKLIVLVGDFVDRGPRSAQVIDYLLTEPAGARRVCLAGNHEHMMLSFVQGSHGNLDWLSLGGSETLLSYGIDATVLSAGLGQKRKMQQALASHIPPEHLEFLATLPVAVRLPGVVIVHAGLRPGRTLEAQDDGDLLGIRGGADRAPEEGEILVHGHTQTAEVVLGERVVSVDTGAFQTGRLSAVRILSDQSRRVLSCSDKTNRRIASIP